MAEPRYSKTPHRDPDETLITNPTPGMILDSRPGMSLDAWSVHMVDVAEGCDPALGTRDLLWEWHKHTHAEHGGGYVCVTKKPHQGGGVYWYKVVNLIITLGGKLMVRTGFRGIKDEPVRLMPFRPHNLLTAIPTHAQKEFDLQQMVCDALHLGILEDEEWREFLSLSPMDHYA